MATSMIPLSDEDLHELYLWIDDIPLSKPKKNIARDFSDGVCVAEVVKFYFPKLVDLHNYSGANSMQQKLTNWLTLNVRVFRKLHFEVPQEEIRDITSAVPGAIERFLRALRTKISQVRSRQVDLSPRDYINKQENEQFQLQQQFQQQQPQQRPATATQQKDAANQRPFQPHVVLHSDRHVAAARDSGSAVQVSQTARQMLEEKDRTVAELKETVLLLNEKVARLEELVRVKDSKINAYKQRLGA